ncbi:MAG: DUF1844 domain-containing protein [Terriglobales bacterium]
MSEKKQESFTVTDRRLFTADGDVRKDISEEQVSTSSAAPAPSPAAAAPDPSRDAIGEEHNGPMPPAPTAFEQQAQADAYRKSSKDLDSRVEHSGHSAKDLEMTFERFMASLYMTAMLQLGLMQEEGGQPRLDLIGARQTIDTLSLLSEKTKGNLTDPEASFLQNCLYELRMAYVEVTNALARPPQAPASAAAKR